jgi:hypothetical protein
MVHAHRSDRGAGMGGAGADEMPTTLKTQAEAEHRDRLRGTLGAEGLAEDMRDVL